jgi:hypothetical protein
VRHRGRDREATHEGAPVAITYASAPAKADEVVVAIGVAGGRGLAFRADSAEAARHMTEGGRIITIGSINADHRPFAGGSAYAMTQAPVAGLTRGLEGMDRARPLPARGRDRRGGRPPGRSGRWVRHRGEPNH